MVMINLEIFHSRLCAARKLRDMTQEELSYRASMPTTSISHFERGSRKPSFDSLLRLAQALNVSADYLMGISNEPKMNPVNDELYKNIQKLTDINRQLVKDFIAMLANT